MYYIDVIPRLGKLHRTFVEFRQTDLKDGEQTDSTDSKDKDRDRFKRQI